MGLFDLFTAQLLSMKAAEYSQKALVQFEGFKKIY